MSTEARGKGLVALLVNYNIYIMLAALIVASTVLSEHFLTAQNIFNLLRQLAPLALVSIGMLLVILTGGIDLSVGSVAAIGGMMVAMAMPTLPFDGGFALILWGDGQARLQPVVLWDSPLWTRHLAGALMLPALVLLVAAQVPGNGIKARVHHPQVLAVKTWALAHLLANNTLADVLLFGGFGLWAVLDFRSARQRDRAAGTVYSPGQPARTALVVVLGLALWAVFAFGAHQWLFGVRPFGR